MTDKVKVVYEPTIDKKASRDVVKKSAKTGKKSGDAFEKQFNQETRNVGKGLGKSTGSFNKSISGFAGKITGSLSKLGTIALGTSAAFAGLGIAVGVASAAAAPFVRAASQQEDALVSLESSLRRIGAFTPQVSQDLQDYASQLQLVSTIGDETTLSLLALAQGYGATVEQSKDAVSAAVDLSAALGIDIESALRNTVKTLGGYAGELGELIPELKTLTQEQLKAGDAITLLGSKFSGIAQDQLSSFRKASQQAGNAFGDFAEAIGEFITQSPAVVALVRVVSRRILGLATTLRNFRERGGDFLRPVIDGILNTAEAINNTLVPIIVGMQRIAIQTAKILTLPLRVVVDAILNLSTLAIDSINRISKAGENPITALKNFSEAAFDTVTKDITSKLKDIGKGFSNLFDDIPIRGQISSFINEARNELDKKQEEINEAFNNSGQKAGGAFGKGIVTGMDAQGVVNAFKKISQNAQREFIPTAENIGNSFRKLSKDFKITARDIAQEIRSSIIGGISSSFTAFGQALATGENGFKAFGKSVLSTIGQLAVTLGQFFILIGAGLTATATILGVSGSAAIAAGIGLTVLGGVLQGIAGSSGSSTGDSAPSGSGLASNTTDIPAPEIPEERDLNKEINVIFQGPVFNAEESGRELVRLINDAFETEGSVIRTTVV